MILRERKLYFLGEEVGLEPKEIDDQSQGGEGVKPERPKEGEEEDACPCDGEVEVPCFVVRKAIISKVLGDPSQRENLFNSKCLIKGVV